MKNVLLNQLVETYNLRYVSLKCHVPVSGPSPCERETQYSYFARFKREAGALNSPLPLCLLPPLCVTVDAITIQKGVSTHLRRMLPKTYPFRYIGNFPARSRFFPSRIFHIPWPLFSPTENFTLYLSVLCRRFLWNPFSVYYNPFTEVTSNDYSSIDPCR